MKSETLKPILIGDAEVQYFTREFGFIVISKKNITAKKIQAFLVQGFSVFVQIGNEPKELEILKNLPEKSVDVILYADETYNLNLNKALIKCKSVKNRFRVYPIWDAGPTRIFDAFFINPLRYHKLCVKYGVIKFIFAYLSGIEIMRRQFFLKVTEYFWRKKSIQIPIGYTDTFAKNYLEFIKNKYQIHLDSEVSLVEFSSRNLRLFYTNKKIDLAFMGQKGNIERQYAVSLISNYENSLVNVKNLFNYSRNAKGISEKLDPYIEAGFSSFRILCPPGNYSALSFRKLESLCFGSLPINVGRCLTDPLYLNQVEDNFIKSWTKALKLSLAFSSGDIEKIVQGKINEVQSNLSHLRSIFWNSKV